VRWLGALLVLSWLAACGDEDGTRPAADAGSDAGAEPDAAVSRDAAPDPDAGPTACRIEAGGDEGAVVPPEASDAHDAIAAIVEDRNVAAVAVALGRGDEIRYAETFGQADPSRGVDATTGTAFLLASVTKTVTAVALLQLVEAGAIDLDADVGDVLGYDVSNPRHPEVPLTARMFLTHTSTLWDVPFTWDETYFVRGDPTLSHSEFVAGYFDPASEWFGGDDAWWDEEPGLFHCYSNMGAAVLGALVEQASGLDLEEYARRNIFEPLGMHRTSFRIASYCDPEDLARGVQWDEGAGRFVDHDNGAPGQPEGHPELASGMLRSTGLDLARFAMAVGGGGAPILGPETTALMTQRQLGAEVVSCGDGRVDPAEQALVWIHFPDASGNDWIGHYGGMNGAATSLWLLEGDAARYVVLMNQSDMDALGAVETALLEAAAPLLAD